jgi:CheY-like chemotaxis protein
MMALCRETAILSAMESEQTATKKMRVLVVDDDLELTLMYQLLLEACHYEVITASDGILALKQILRQDVDVILCDLRMAELDGDLFYQAVERAKPALCSRFLFITGEAEDPDYHAFLSRVKAPVLRKPVQPAKLLEEVQKLLSRQAGG